MEATPDPRSQKPGKTQSDPGGAPCRWTRRILVLSLALNLLIVGLIGGLALGGGPERHRVKTDNTGLFLSALDRRDRRAMLREVRQQGFGPAASRRAARDQFHSLVAALRADGFSPESVQKALDAQSALAEQRRSAGQRAFVARLATMSADERRALADRLETLLEKRRPPRDARQPGL